MAEKRPPNPSDKRKSKEIKVTYKFPPKDPNNNDSAINALYDYIFNRLIWS